MLRCGDVRNLKVASNDMVGNSIRGLMVNFYDDFVLLKIFMGFVCDRILLFSLSDFLENYLRKEKVNSILLNVFIISLIHNTVYI